MKRLLENWNGFLVEGEKKKLRVFDIDDTLIKTDGVIYVTKADGTSFALNPGEYAVYEPDEGDEFDYREFFMLKNPREIKPVMNIFRNIVRAGLQGRKVTLLTARAAAAEKDIRHFFDKVGIDHRALEIIMLGDSDPGRKAEYIEKQIQRGYNDILFLDDSSKNVEAVSRLGDKYPDVKLDARMVDYGGGE